MTQRQNIASGAKWEPVVGYSRAVRVGKTIHVSGTVAADDAGNVIGVNNAYEQTRFILQKIERALQQAGAKITDVVRTRIYTVNAALWQDIAKAHQEVFAEILPASTMLEVSALIGSDYLVEIEAEAILSAED
jgi:enamine deaminase RidA (YjgF/YER057c/UK114 family)